MFERASWAVIAGRVLPAEHRVAELGCEPCQHRLVDHGQRRSSVVAEHLKQKNV